MKQEELKVSFKVAPNKRDRFNKATMLKMFKALGGFKRRTDWEGFVTDSDGLITYWVFEARPVLASRCLYCTMCEGEGNLIDKEVCSRLDALKGYEPEEWDVEYETY